MIRLVVSVAVLMTSSFSMASFQSGMSVEMVMGYPQMTASVGTSEARYGGISVAGNLILPLLDYENSFSTDLTLGYRYTNYQNSASSQSLAEWAQLQGFNPGVRFNVKYFYLGTDISFLKGRHLISGTNSQIFDYYVTPIQAYVGVHIPIGKVISLAASYSQHIVPGSADVAGQSIEINEQVFMITMQVDLGIGFMNVIKDDSLFDLREDYSYE